VNTYTCDNVTSDGFYNCQGVAVEGTTYYCEYNADGYYIDTNSLKPAEICYDGVDNDCDGSVDEVGCDLIFAYNLTELYSQDRNKIFGFKIGVIESSNVSWSVDMGDGTIIASSYSLDLATFKPAFVFIEHNFTQDGAYSVQVNVTNGTITDSEELTVYVGNLVVSEFDSAYTSTKEAIFEFKVFNNGEDSLAANWSLDTGADIVYADELIELEPGEEGFVYFQTNYSVSGTYTANATVFNGTYSASKTLTLDIFDIKVSDFEILYYNRTIQTFGLRITNTLNNSVSNITWILDTGNGNVSSQEQIELESGEDVFIYVGYNYSAYGGYTAEIVVTSGVMGDSAELDFSVVALDVKDLVERKSTGSNRIFEFILKNYLDSVLEGVNWSFKSGDGGVVNSAEGVNISSGEEVFVYVEYNYTSAGDYVVNVTASGGGYSDEEAVNVTIN